jgi:hypothetical protein
MNPSVGYILLDTLDGGSAHRKVFTYIWERNTQECRQLSMSQVGNHDPNVRARQDCTRISDHLPEFKQSRDSISAHRGDMETNFQ